MLARMSTETRSATHSGRFARAAAFSLYPAWKLDAAGDGVAARARSLRQFGWRAARRLAYGILGEVPSLHCFPHLTDAETERVIDACNRL